MKTIAVFLFEDVSDYEITLAMHLLHADAAMRLLPFAYERGTIRARSGMIYQVDATVLDVKASEVDGILLPGGQYALLRPELRDLLRELKQDNRLIAGICGAGTILLAQAGMLDDVAYTTPVKTWDAMHQVRYQMNDPFPRMNCKDAPVVVDQKIVTAIGTSFVRFAVEICDQFNLFATNQEKEEFFQLMTT